MPITESTRSPSDSDKKGKSHVVPAGTVSKIRKPADDLVIAPSLAAVNDIPADELDSDTSSSEGATSTADGSQATSASADDTQQAATDVSFSASGSASSASDSSSSDDVAETREADAEAVNEPQGPMLYAIPKVACLSCGHFNTEATKFYTKCHFSQGSGPGEAGELCPAQELQIRVSIPKERIAKNLATYTIAGDIEGYNRVSNKLVEAARAGKVTALEFQQIKAREQELVLEMTPETKSEPKVEKHKSKKHKSKSKDKKRKHKSKSKSSDSSS